MAVTAKYRIEYRSGSETKPLKAYVFRFEATDEYQALKKARKAMNEKFGQHRWLSDGKCLGSREVRVTQETPHRKT